MQPVPVESYSELRRRARSLQHKSSDRPLVYRGQTDWYGGRIVPSIARAESSAYEQDLQLHWQWAAVDILAEMVAKYAEYLEQEGKPVPRTLGNVVDHARALLQHYGARSSVDVTESLDVALWFSHQRHRQREEILSGEELSGDDPGLPVAFDIAWYEPAWKPDKGRLGYLLVLAPNRPQGPLLRHGDLLRLTPNVIARRIAQQQAALIFADPEADSGDLHKEYLEGAYQFPLPLPGAPETVTNPDARRFFPPPDKDLMLSLLLARIPFREVLERRGVLRRALAIPEYFAVGANAVRSGTWPAYRKCDRFLPFTFLFELLTTGADASLECSLGRRSYHLRDALPVLMVVPSRRSVLAPEGIPEWRLLPPRGSIFLEYDALQLMEPLFRREPHLKGVWVVRAGRKIFCRLFQVDLSQDQLQIQPSLGHTFKWVRGKGPVSVDRHAASDSIEAHQIEVEGEQLAYLIGQLHEANAGGRRLEPGLGGYLTLE